MYVNKYGKNSITIHIQEICISRFPGCSTPKEHMVCSTQNIAVNIDITFTNILIPTHILKRLSGGITNAQEI